jgi:hypothetical protein
LARSDESAAAVSALSAKVHCGSIEDLNGLKRRLRRPTGSQTRPLPSGGINAVAAAELQIMPAYGGVLDARTQDQPLEPLPSPLPLFVRWVFQ